MMSVSEYALDVDKSVSEILNLCKKLELSISNEEDMLSDDDIIMLDIELASLETKKILLASSDELLLGEKETEFVNCADTFIFEFSPTSIPRAKTYARFDIL